MHPRARTTRAPPATTHAPPADIHPPPTRALPDAPATILGRSTNPQGPGHPLRRHTFPDRRAHHAGVTLDHLSPPRTETRRPSPDPELVLAISQRPGILSSAGPFLPEHE